MVLEQKIFSDKIKQIENFFVKEETYFYENKNVLLPSDIKNRHVKILLQEAFSKKNKGQEHFFIKKGENKIFFDLSLPRQLLLDILIKIEDLHNKPDKTTEELEIIKQFNSKKQYFFYFLFLMWQKLSSGNLKKENHIPVSRNYLHQLFHNSYTKIIKLAEFLEIGKFTPLNLYKVYVKHEFLNISIPKFKHKPENSNEKCRCFSFNKKYISQEKEVKFVKLHIDNKKLLNKFFIKEKLYERNNCFKTNRLKKNLKSSELVLKNKTIIKNQQELLSSLLISKKEIEYISKQTDEQNKNAIKNYMEKHFHFDKKGYYSIINNFFSSSNRNKRIYTSFSYMPKSLRDLLQTKNGERFVELDARNMYFYLLSILFQKSFWESEKSIPIIKYIELTNRETNLLKELAYNEEWGKELKIFTQACSNGTIYRLFNLLRRSKKIRYHNRTLLLEADAAKFRNTKISLNSMLNDKYSNRNKYDFYHILFRTFPFIDRFKKGIEQLSGHTRISTILGRLESYLNLETFYFFNDLSKDILSLHDGFYVKVDEKNKILNLLKENYKNILPEGIELPSFSNSYSEFVLKDMLLSLSKIELLRTQEIYQTCLSLDEILKENKIRNRTKNYDKLKLMKFINKCYYDFSGINKERTFNKKKIKAVDEAIKITSYILYSINHHYINNNGLKPENPYGYQEMLDFIEIKARDDLSIFESIFNLGYNNFLKLFEEYKEKIYFYRTEIA